MRSQNGGQQANRRFVSLPVRHFDGMGVLFFCALILAVSLKRTPHAPRERLSV